MCLQNNILCLGRNHYKSQLYLQSFILHVKVLGSWLDMIWTVIPSKTVTIDDDRKTFHDKMKFKQFISTNSVPPPNKTLEGKISFEEVNYTQEVTGKNNLRTAYQLSGKKSIRPKQNNRNCKDCLLVTLNSSNLQITPK